MIDLSGIIAVSGYSGLFKVVAQAKNGVIVENLSDKKRMPAYSNYKISALEEISMFTSSEDVALAQVFQNIYDKEKGKKCIDAKSSAPELVAYLAQVFPDFDRERVHNSDIKKLFTWYNILHETENLKVKEEEKKDTKSKKAKSTDAETTEVAEGTTTKKATKAKTTDTKPKTKAAAQPKAKATAAPARKTTTVRKTGA
jgi:hypothetical protein